MYVLVITIFSAKSPFVSLIIVEIYPYPTGSLGKFIKVPSSKFLPFL